jgi:phosphogluconate dehydratase
LASAFEAGELEQDLIAVVRFQGPAANGMPELHKMTPYLGILQDRGFKVALVTDGRMSGASGKVPAAIHLTPEALSGGDIARVRDGDMLRLDAQTGELNCLVPEAEWQARVPATRTSTESDSGTGRELFAHMRNAVADAESGAGIF